MSLCTVDPQDVAYVWMHDKSALTLRPIAAWRPHRARSDSRTTYPLTTGAPEPRQEEADMDTIERLCNLDHNWDSNGASAPNEAAADHARTVVLWAGQLGVEVSAITPSAEDGIGVVFRRGNLYADIECYNDGSVLAVTSDGSGDPRVWEVGSSPAGIAEALGRIRDYLGGAAAGANVS
jgi:hypothetical protein